QYNKVAENIEKDFSRILGGKTIRTLQKKVKTMKVNTHGNREQESSGVINIDLSANKFPSTVPPDNNDEIAEESIIVIYLIMKNQCQRTLLPVKIEFH
ncbi:16130_t:CDS:1, partial [Acaulospora morrowiae]